MSNHSLIRVAPDFETRYPDANAGATACAMNLAYTADLLLKRIAGLLQPFDLTPASGLVLGILADSPEPLPPNEIADRLIISRATVTGLLDSLESRAFVRRTPHPTDRRMLLIELTVSGRETAGAYRPLVHKQQREWFGVLTEKEKQQLIDALQRVQASLMD